MQAQLETLSALERRLSIAVPREEIAQQVNARLKHVAKTAKIDGFRPGKAPMNVVAQSHGFRVQEEVLGETVERAFGEAIVEQKLQVAGYPRFEAKQDIAVDGDFEFLATFEVYPEVTLGDLSAIEVQKPTLVVGDDEVNKTIDILRSQRTRYERVERAAVDGDRVIIDFKGTIDGVAFEGGSSDNYAILPALDADFAKSLGIEDGDVEKMRAEVKGNLEREVRFRLKSRIKESAMSAVIEASPIELPRSLISLEIGRLVEGAQADLKQRGIDPATVPFQPALFEAQARRRVHLGLALSQLVEAEKLTTQPEQIKSIIEDLAQNYEDPSEVVAWYYASPDRLAGPTNMALEDNVVDFVLSKAKVTEQVVAFDELMGQQGQ